MLVEKVMNTTDNQRSFDFLNKVLPSAILNNHDILSKGIHIKDILEEQICMHWENYCEKNDYSKDPYPDFEFIYTTRLKLNRQKNLNSGIFFLRMPEENGVYIEDTQISGALLVSDNGTVKFFGLKELTEDLVPKRFIKNNQNYLLYELNKELDFTNWGKLINPRNFSELSESIFLIGEV